MSQGPVWRSMCAVCGVKGELHEHHLVPRSLGGTILPSVMLCSEHHGQVHTLRYPTNHAMLTRIGLEKAKRRGVKLGGPNLRSGADPEAAQRGRAAQTLRRQQHALAIIPVIREIQDAGFRSLRTIAAALTERGVLPPYGHERWHATQVRRLLLLAGDLERAKDC